ncbi:MAG: hypothetical protein ACI9G1_002732 [Pirellulaceae bacterium]|jgi:hypothetical protein
MDSKTRQLLLDADCVGQWEEPLGGPLTSLKEVEELLPRIEAIVGYSLEIDENVQDASFLTEIGLLSSPETGPDSQTMFFVFILRFSNFGRLVSFGGCQWEERFDELRLGEVVELLETSGFNYIPPGQLDEPYDGINGARNPVDDEPLSWWTRFFDYL